MLYIAVLVGLDQYTKYLVSHRFSLGESVPVTSFFHLTYVTNTGVAFSMFQNANAFFAAFAVIVLAGFAAWYWKNRQLLDRIMKTALLLIAAGAVGNLIDRLAHGFVIDFLDFSIGGYHWPSFNVADSCISVGGVFLFFRLLFPLKTAVEGRAGGEVK